MEKTIHIDSRPVRFKCTAGTLFRYRNQFNREFIADLARLETISPENYESLTLAPLYNIVWVMAKTADDSVPDMLTWLDGFEYFPIVEVFTALQDVIMASMKTKNSSAAAALPPAKQHPRRR